MQHFVLTRFSYRGARVNTAEDPLEPDRLRRRMQLFETITAPSLAAQTNDDFTWVVIVDPALPESYRARLRAINGRSRPLRVAEYGRATDVDSLEWLENHGLAADAQWVLTTNLDDDDALATGYLESVRSEAEHALDRSQPLTLFGAAAAREWRFQPQPGLTLGRMGPWQRAMPVSAGLSLLSDRAALDVSVLAMRHRDAVLYGSPVLPEDLPAFRRRRIEHVHGLIRAQVGDQGISQFYRPLSGEDAEALMVTHLDNVQASRLFDAAEPGCDAAAELARFGVDSERVAGIAGDMQLGWRDAFGQARRLYRSDVWPVKKPRASHRLRLGWSAGRRVLAGMHEPTAKIEY